MVNAFQFIFILSQVERTFFSITLEIFSDTKKFFLKKVFVFFSDACGSISANFSRPVCVVN